MYVVVVRQNVRLNGERKAAWRLTEAKIEELSNLCKARVTVMHADEQTLMDKEILNVQKFDCRDFKNSIVDSTSDQA